MVILQGCLLDRDGSCDGAAELVGCTLTLGILRKSDIARITCQ